MYSTTAVKTVVTCESMIVAMAREKPLRMAIRSEAPRPVSSRIRS